MPVSKNRRKSGKKSQKWKVPTGRPCTEKPAVTIEVSPHTGDFLVMIGDLLFDSAIKRSDAEVQAEMLREVIEKHPLPYKPSLPEFFLWTHQHTSHIPINDSIGYHRNIDGEWETVVQDGAALTKVANKISKKTIKKMLKNLIVI